MLEEYPPRLSHSRDTLRFRDGSCVVHYSIDTALQNTGMDLLNRYHPLYGAVVVVEPATGRVLALLSYTGPEAPQRFPSLYTKSKFPAASIFKIIAAAGAIEKTGLNAESVVPVWGRNHTLYNSQLREDLPDSREVTLREAFAYSINPAFGRIGIFMLGSRGLNEYAVKFGFNSDVPFELGAEKPVFIFPDSAFAVAEAASGFNQHTTISPLFGALIAAAVSNRGVILAPTIVDSVTDLASGENRYTRLSMMWRIPMRQKTADEVMLLMKDVARYGTARKSFRYLKQSDRFNDFDYGGKTGSVDKEGFGKVDWFVGFCKHRQDRTQHVTVGAVTVHGAYWTVHSSYIGTEMMRKHIREMQVAKSRRQCPEGDSISLVRIQAGNIPPQAQ